MSEVVVPEVLDINRVNDSIGKNPEIVTNDAEVVEPGKVDNNICLLYTSDAADE